MKSHPVVQAADQLLPFLSAALLFILACSSSNDTIEALDISISLGFISLQEHTLHLTTLIRIAIGSAGLGCLLWGMTRDYTRHFPTLLSLNVYFTDNAVADALRQFSAGELERLDLLHDWVEPKDQYLNRVARTVRRRLNVQFPINAANVKVESSGWTTFIVKKISWRQEYCITVADGFLLHVFERPGSTATEMETRFELHDNERRLIVAKLRDFLKGTIVIAPEFTQFVRLPSGRQFGHTVRAVTKVRFFPIPGIGRTVYFVNEGSTRRWIPIGVAFCREMTSNE